MQKVLIVFSTRFQSTILDDLEGFIPSVSKALLIFGLLN